MMVNNNLVGGIPTPLRNDGHQVTTSHHQSHGLFVHQAATASGTVGMSVVQWYLLCLQPASICDPPRIKMASPTAAAVSR